MLQCLSQILSPTGSEIVDAPDGVASSKQLIDRVTADESGGAGDDDLLRHRGNLRSPIWYVTNVFPPAVKEILVLDMDKLVKVAVVARQGGGRGKGRNGSTELQSCGMAELPRGTARVRAEVETARQSCGTTAR